MNTKWIPNPGPQEEALRRIEFEILYGGARGGGKTDAGLVWLMEFIHHPRYRALVIRKNADDLSDWVDRAYRMYKLKGVSIAYRPPILTFPSGAIIRTGHLKDDQAYTKYQGHEYQRMLIEELTQIATETRYLQLVASCRSTIPEIRPQIFCTTNPGGRGHTWVKNRFITDHIPGMPFRDENTGQWRIFIPAKVDDNPILNKVDPGYVKTLEGLKKTDEQLWKAWRLGDWDIFVGQFFREWLYAKHVSDHINYSLDVCKKIICYDWGYTAPGCAIWLALTPENKHGVRHVFAYRELYQNSKSPEQWAEDIKTFTSREKVDYIVLPHDCFSHAKGDRSIADTFKKIGGLRIVEGHTLERGARLNRAAITHQFLGDAKDGLPYLIVHPNCRNLIRTLPDLVHDEFNIEDVDSDGEDHAYDALSLGLLSLIQKGKRSSAVKHNPERAKVPFVATGIGAQQLGPDFLEAIKREALKPRRG